MRHQFARLADSGEDLPGATAYVERGGEQVTRHPFDFSGVNLFGFAVRADRDRLAELCDRSFGIPSGGAERYEPVGEHVVVAFTEIVSMQSTDAPDASLGDCSEREAGVWVPVLDRRRGRACWTMPYLFVDETAPMVGGREIFGFPKQFGQVAFPAPNEEPTSFGLSAACIARFDPGSRIAHQQVLTARRTDAGSPTEPPWQDPAAGVHAMSRHSGRAHHPDGIPPQGAVGGFAGLADSLAHGRVNNWIDEARAVGVLLSHLAFGRLPIVLLKQFRDVADPRRACYQSIVEVEQELLQFDGGALLPGRWQVDVADLDGEPLQRELGLPPEAAADLAFRLEFKFRILPGRVLWEARR